MRQFEKLPIAIENKPSWLGDVITISLHPSSVVKIEHAGELAYVLAWCDLKKINVTVWQRRVSHFPIALALNQVNLEWTDKFDRNLYYVSFDDFKRQVNFD